MTCGRLGLVLAACMVLALPARAQIRIGVILSLTGPASALGVPEQRTVNLLPREVAGQKVEFTVLDDASDTTEAVKAASKLVQDGKVDAILGPSTTPNALAVVDVAAGSSTPMVSLASSARIVEPADGARRWAFKVPQGDNVQAEATVARMQAAGVRKAAFIGFSDAYGMGMEQEFLKAAKARGIDVAAVERFAPRDSSVLAQVLHILGAKPDAVFIGASGTPAVLPEATLRERGFTGLIFQTNGVASNDFLRVGGKNVEGARLLVTPMLVAEQLPADNPSRPAALEFLAQYEGRYGAGSRSNFAALAWDGWQIIAHAIPAALRTAAPGTPEFRAALRDGIEATRGLALNTGVFTYGPTDHAGLDARDMVLVEIRNGGWQMAR